MKLVAIDPGIRGCGVALFENGVLRAAKYVKNPTKQGQGVQAWTTMSTAVRTFLAEVENDESHLPWSPDLNVCVIEIPRVYPGPQQKGDQNDLITIACVAATICADLKPEEASQYFPSEWKGNVPADLMLERIMERLSPEESARIISVGEKDHNTVDSIGIGLKKLGRLEPKRVFAR